MLPGTSGSSLRRMPPPPLSEYVNRWYSPPPGMGKLGLNFQPRAASHHAFVAAGSELASSVCVIQPRSEEHTSELQSRGHLVCRLLLEKKNNPNGLYKSPKHCTSKNRWRYIRTTISDSI